jgi:hypothetical protein
MEGLRRVPPSRTLPLSEHVQHGHGDFVKRRDCHFVTHVMALTRDRGESSIGNAAVCISPPLFWGRHCKTSRLETLLLSGDRQSFYPYPPGAFTGSAAIMPVDSAAMECMK